MSSITLTNNGVTLQLYEGLQWVDEFAWSPVAMTAEYSTDGSLLIDQAARLAGRPITLETPSGADWATTREQVQLLHAWASRLAEPLQLRLRGQVYTVVFDHTRGAAFEATLAGALADAEINAQVEYRITLRFLEV
ncbi:hypothetical protein CK623_11405 [Vandammella animalimorsus]|uniref:Uncharacterized protein n=1 Tax=Vandammella animalimorsus TaxID=2029117 RepID=A0A2A2AN72_9BURK|nr:hypothetical protein [Vandammella animalimorsus]PAT39162.1 hypothetical protein CK623_11405 [Vandammella animalimorsus]